jgi:hypothetical protein
MHLHRNHWLPGSRAERRAQYLDFVLDPVARSRKRRGIPFFDPLACISCPGVYSEAPGLPFLEPRSCISWPRVLLDAPCAKTVGADAIKAAVETAMVGSRVDGAFSIAYQRAFLSWNQKRRCMKRRRKWKASIGVCTAESAWSPFTVRTAGQSFSAYGVTTLTPCKLKLRSGPIVR